MIQAWLSRVATVALAAAALSSTALAADPPKADAARGQQIAAGVCASCHGADGNSAIAANPKLAAQHAQYTVKQLANFVPADGKPAQRANAVMLAFAMQLSEQDRRDVAAFYASQPLKPAVARNKELVELGQKIYRGGIASKDVPSCAGCHGPNGAGIPAQYPRMAGQWAEYTEAQLLAFRSGERNNSQQMSTIAARLSDREIKALAEYLAGLR